MNRIILRIHRSMLSFQVTTRSTPTIFHRLANWQGTTSLLRSKSYGRAQPGGPVASRDQWLPQLDQLRARLAFRNSPCPAGTGEAAQFVGFAEGSKHDRDGHATVPAPRPLSRLDTLGQVLRRFGALRINPWVSCKSLSFYESRGLRQRRVGKEVQSRSAVQSSRTPWLRQREAMRAS